MMFGRCTVTNDNQKISMFHLFRGTPLVRHILCPATSFTLIHIYVTDNKIYEVTIQVLRVRRQLLLKCKNGFINSINKYLIKNIRIFLYVIIFIVTRIIAMTF